MIRSSRPEVRNPLLTLPAMQKLAALPRPVRELLRQVAHEISRDCRSRANKAWATHKPPMAAYWKAMSVYFRHGAAALNSLNRTAR